MNTCREMLDEIDKFLVRGDTEAQKLWDVLTALRGPDNESLGLKSKTTCVIRVKAFPLCAEAAQGYGYHLGASFEGGTYVRDSVSSHFHTHANHAARALGII